MIFKTFLILLFLLIPIQLFGSILQSIHIEWGYTPPSAPAVRGFKLYQEGLFVCQILDPVATSMDCMVTLTSATTMFTLTAYFNDDTESPHSSQFGFITPVPAPLNLIITVKESK